MNNSTLAQIHGCTFADEGMNSRQQTRLQHRSRLVCLEVKDQLQKLEMLKICTLPSLLTLALSSSSFPSVAVREAEGLEGLHGHSKATIPDQIVTLF